MTSTPPGEQPLDQALRGVHEAWIRQARRFLEPALGPRADFWTRWAAVRYLDDEFRDCFDLERRFLAELRPLLAPVTAERLVLEADRVFRLRLEVDRAGRRRGTAEEVAAAAAALLDQLVLWLAEVEQGAVGLTRDILAAEGEMLLGHLEAAHSATA
jgi:hypothetical protein